MAISDTHDLGRAYFHTMRVPRGGPLVELGTSHEVEEPWRVGRCLVLRLWRLALVLGWWGQPRTFEQMEREEAAALGVELPTEEIRENFRPQPVEAPVDVDWAVR